MGQSLGCSELTHTHFLQQSLRILKSLIMEETLPCVLGAESLWEACSAPGAAVQCVGAFGAGAL